MKPKPVLPPSVQEFAERLRNLHIRSGAPSYKKIQKAADQHGEHPLTPSTVSFVLNGHRMPGLDFTISFVRTLIRLSDQAYADDHVDPADANHPLVKEWRERWEQTQQLVRAQLKPAGVDSGTRELDRVRGAVLRRDKPRLPDSIAPGAAAEELVLGDHDGPASTDLLQSQPLENRVSVRPTKDDLLPPQIRSFRALLNQALSATDEQGRVWAKARVGCYVFYDYDGEPLYVGQTNEALGTRVRRHLTLQRTDAVAMRLFDVQDVAELELWPLWHLENAPRMDPSARHELDSLERAVHLKAISESRFHILLNERLPPAGEILPLPPSRRFALVDENMRREKKGMPTSESHDKPPISHTCPQGYWSEAKLAKASVETCSFKLYA
ncbi:hypothetical protein GCM10020001_034870 [Nonomuraea salmonea]